MDEIEFVRILQVNQNGGIYEPKFIEMKIDLDFKISENILQSNEYDKKIVICILS